MDGRGNKLSSSVGRCALKHGKEEIGKKVGPGEFYMGEETNRNGSLVLVVKRDIRFGQIPSNDLRK